MTLCPTITLRQAQPDGRTVRESEQYFKLEKSEDLPSQIPMETESSVEQIPQ
jgi:hypothetical protein